jgi:excinuclease ABC subunit A
LKASHIRIKGARLHNLKNIDVGIPRNSLTVITGLSGSGKSSLAFDTLYAEGQRRYVESLSSYARQFLGKLDKPKVDHITGIAPAIAIEQKVTNSNPRSIVGSTTEIYDYLKLLYARIGKTYSPISGEPVRRDTVSDVVDYIISQGEGSKWLLIAPINTGEKREAHKLAKLYSEAGFARVKYNNKVYRIDQLPENFKGNFELVVDRIIVRKEDEDFKNRLSTAVDNAFFEGKGTLHIESMDTDLKQIFNDRFEKDGITFDQPSIHLFSFNNPLGACKKCEGYGDLIGIDPTLVIPNTSLSIYEGAIAPWNTDRFVRYKDQLIAKAASVGISIHKPWFELSDETKLIIWKERKLFTGIDGFFDRIEEKNYKIQNRVLLSRYRGKSECPECEGKRLRKEASYVKVVDKSIADLLLMPAEDLLSWIKNIELSEHDKAISERIIIETTSRLEYLVKVGLGYLTLNRKSSTLSGGESQRIHLANAIGSSLVGSMYILDEPTIGLHSKDTHQIIEVLQDLRDLGNTVIIVEHDEDIIKSADYLIDIGPLAGSLGGEVIAEGPPEQLLKSDSLTVKYLTGRLEIPVPTKRIKPNYFIEIKGARAHNLKNIDVSIPLDCLTVVTGVSGSGKSTLIRGILYPALLKHLQGHGPKALEYDHLGGSLNRIEAIEMVDQNPIGRSSRSNPVTYIKAYDDIRELMTRQKRSKLNQFKAKHFSFNIDGGRCDHCKGDGEVTVEMQFMADVVLTCEECKGTRFKEEVLEVQFQEKNIHDLLKLTVQEAYDFFETHGEYKIARKLRPLIDVGLGYVQLGQSSATLSGGEAQRIKLASFLSKGNNSSRTLFIFDEPTTGLHFHDIKLLLDSFNALIANGHTVIVVEHHLDLIKCADHIIDLGPVGGHKGGQLLAVGTPEEVVLSKDSYTAEYLKSKT